MEPSDGYHRLSLPGMPTEILSLVANLADSGSLKALRLTNKRLCAISSGPFAKRYFSERKHVASTYSMEALVEITAHPFFGKFVKTIIISGSRPEIRENPFLKGVPRSCAQCPGHISLCKNPPPHHLAMGSKQFRVKLEETFSNIKSHLSSVFVGVCDSAFGCYGSMYYHANCDMITSQRNYPDCYYSQRDECNQFVKTFKEIFEAAYKSGCKIDGIKLDIFSICMPYTDNTHHGREVNRLLRYVLGRLPGTLSFELNLDIGNSCNPRYYLRYDRKTAELELAGLNLHANMMLEDICPRVDSMLSRLSNCPINHIKLRKCWFERSDLVWLYSQTLKTLKLDNNKIGSATLTGPNHGLYEVKGQLAWELIFILAPSEDLDEAIIMTDQTSISGQLKALADQVAQMERDKVAEIEREGYVRTDFVGISKDSQPEEDIVPDENDHNDIGNGGSDETSDDRGEREGNDGQDEHEHTNELPAT